MPEDIPKPGWTTIKTPMNPTNNSNVLDRDTASPINKYAIPYETMGPMKKAPYTFAMGSVFSAVRIENMPPLMKQPRNSTRRSRSIKKSDLLTLTKGKSSTAASAKRDHATRPGATPSAVRSLPAVSPKTTNPAVLAEINWL